jgi:hypothetical protein
MALTYIMQVPYAHMFCTPAQIAMSVSEEVLSPSIPTDVPVGIQVCAVHCMLLLAGVYVSGDMKQVHSNANMLTHRSKWNSELIAVKK